MRLLLLLFSLVALPLFAQTQVAPYSSLEAQDTSIVILNLVEEQCEVDCFPQPACKWDGEQLGF